ncbi:copper-sensing transcription factor [Metarhizium rileyi]|uniref:Copper-sensing transcription factor n=1 Tax=Metarhizium rileyi (strain RCEF 4871) TaxID=1649241 RepID=A0A167KKR7_METRR|nr:copper-sensing transcription factor [Metarhizium rileyi RCEF 4871]
MACEPCIRGHRSTKCTHANERLMVPVRKPGRPLSSCPHPSSRSCSCAAVTAAIPRKQKCRCGSSDPLPAETKLEPDALSGNNSSSSATTPPSPSKFGSAGFRVRKQGTKPGTSRKQSVDIAGLQRMDANHLNILPSYNGVNSQQMSTPNGSSTPISEMPLYGSMTMTPGAGSFGPETAMFPMFPHAMAPPLMPTGPIRVPANGQNEASANGSVKTEAEAPKSCCGGSNVAKSQIDVSTAPAPLTSAASVNGNGNGGHESEPKGCCSSSPSSTSQQKKPTGIMFPPGVPFPPNGVMIPPFQHPMAMANGMYPFYAQPNIFNYPPHYGSFLQPLQPEQWRQLMAAMSFGQPGGSQAFDMTGPVPVPLQQPPPTPNGSSWTSHQCTCGDTCQCVGCAAHPYNDATQNYVRSAWSSMMEEAQTLHAHTNGKESLPNGQTNGVSEMKGANEEMEGPTKTTSSGGTTTPNKANRDGTWSPAAPQTPSDAASGLSEEQALSASDFFFVSYPFGDTCAGETSSCLCGDDCQCIGCTIHNNTGSTLRSDEAAA